MPGKNSLSDEERLAAIIKYGEHGPIIVEIAAQPNIIDQLEGIANDVMIRIEFTRWIRNSYELWPRFKKIVGDRKISTHNVDDHDEHPDQVSYDIAEAVCGVLGVPFRES